MSSAAIEKRLNEVRASIKALKGFERDLTRQGCVHAYAHFKTGTRKMFLYAPVDEDGRRKHTYIGVDPQKQQAALASIERFHQREKVRQHIAALETNLKELQYQVKELVEDCRDLALESMKQYRHLVGSQIRARPQDQV